MARLPWITGGPSVTTRVLTRERGWQEGARPRRRRGDRSRGGSNGIAGWKTEGSHKPRNTDGKLEVRKGRKGTDVFPPDISTRNITAENLVLGLRTSRR